MAKHNEEFLQLKGFNHGYIIASENPKLYEQLLQIQTDPDYLKGFIKGRERFEKDRAFFKDNLNPSKDRKSILKQIAERDRKERLNENRER